jgi:uncharacterized 2Fe-2S/4Fe-4S cluster protein (DUF4445 family)
MITVTIKHHGTYRVKTGTRLLGLFTREHIHLPAVCGGRSRCGQCRVRIAKDKRKHDKFERLFIPEHLARQGYHLACRVRIHEDTVVTLPTRRKSALTPQQHCGLALDLGTTVLKAALVDLRSRKTVGTAHTLNLQNTAGGDVITRIGMAVRGEYHSLRRMLMKSIKDLIRELGSSRPLFTAVTGNPVMLSFYLNQPVDGLRAFPFKSSLDQGIFRKKPRGYVFPVVGGFIGGDVIAGLLASGICDTGKTMLYIDLGTNGEVVLITPNRIIAASAAAGPAFEGIGITSGSLAVPGAVNRVGFERGQFTFSTIDDKEAVGICASGLIDLLLVAMEHGYIQNNGRLLKKVTVGCFSLSQSDIRKLQLAVGAIRSCLRILLKTAELTPQMIDGIIITGEMGRSLERSALIQLGLIPSTIKRIITSKDLPLKGAIIALTEDNAFERINEIKKKSEHIEIALEPDFQAEFVRAMRFSSWT